jgi:hypothetical protein
MIDKLKRSREPLSWLAIGFVVVGIGLAAWHLTVDFAEMSVFAAFQEAGTNWLNGFAALAVAVLVMSCSLTAPPVQRARLITQVAAIVLGVGVLLTLISTLLGMWASAGGFLGALDALGGLIEVAFKAVMAGAVWVFWRALRAGRIESTDPEPASGPESVSADESTPSDPTVTELAEDVEADGAENSSVSAATMPRDPNAGAVWWSAADAAAGAPARDQMPEGAPSAEE